MKPVGFIYLTTNLINGKIYIGQHEFLGNDSGYIGSGVYFRNAVKKYGKQNFKRKILKICYTYAQMNAWEIVFIKKYKSQDRNVGYNIAKGNVHTSKLNPSKLPEVREKISKTLRRKIDSGEIKPFRGFSGSSHPLYGKHHSEETKKKISESKRKQLQRDGHPLKGKSLSEETRQKISQGNKLFAKLHREERSAKMKGKLAGEKHPLYGKHRSAETRQKISKSHMGKLTGSDNPNYKHGGYCKYKTELVNESEND